MLKKLLEMLQKMHYKVDMKYNGVSVIMYGATDGNPCLETEEGSDCVVKFMKHMIKVINNIRLNTDSIQNIMNLSWSFFLD